MAEDMKNIGSVLVVGAGIAGIQASLDLANAGILVHLVDNQPSIGGIMPQLDKTFPTNDCSMCIVSPKLVDAGRHLNINKITMTDIESIEGEPGNMTVTLVNRPRYIDIEACTGCGVCRENCPVTAVNEFNRGLDQRTATYIKYPQAVPLAYTIDTTICVGCGLCEKLCLAKAVHYTDEVRRTELNVGGVILAMGNEVFDPSVFNTYPYASHPNVVTSAEFERILSASGPYKGHLMRPYDRNEPAKIAWLQCVGSRDINHCDHGYCSAVCCMYAIKEAVIAKEHAHEDLDVAIFFMDMRTYGKDFEKYYDRARNEHGVRFIRSRVHTVDPGDDGSLRLSYTSEDGEQIDETFDMVVLSVGFQPSAQAISLLKRLDIKLNHYNYPETSTFSPVTTSRPGVYVCGALRDPKDIPASVMEASAAAAAVSAPLSDSRFSLTMAKELPAERNVFGEPPRIGVFVCNCGINIGGVADVPAVRDYAKTLPNVAHVEDNLFTCSQDTQAKIKDAIVEHNLNRVVVASCSPRTHEPMFQETIREAGLNKYLFDMANIRDQCTWVHQNDPAGATAKAKDLVRMAVAKAGLLNPLDQVALSVNKAALVIGGGVAGMVAAQSVSAQGFEVHLLEKSDHLGGQALNLLHTWKGEPIGEFVAKLVAEVESDPRVNVHFRTGVRNSTGFLGNFETELYSLDDPKKTEFIKHGIVIAATGGGEYKPDEYLYGQDERVLTSLELDARMKDGDPLVENAGTAVFIQCVGSREPDRPYCSKVCCTHTVHSALELKKKNPDMRVFVLYRDVRTYGFREDIFKEARSRGVIFIRYETDRKPRVASTDGKLAVRVLDPILQRELEIETDLVTLATAIVPNEIDEIQKAYKMQLNPEGFLLEAHAKLRPVDFGTAGFFMCGLAHYPKPLDEAIAQAQAAAARATTILAMEAITVGGAVAVVDPDKCAVCLTCVRTCPYNVPYIGQDGYAVIEPALCQGCGACVAECPGKAITLQHFTDAQILAKAEALAA
ncbi:MAG: FAD-dependent oxidoreductase [Proteobacteria bacterium]|nr:FAD-dependent oxidoreductase [Pseudomonadota bacterium]